MKTSWMRLIDVRGLRLPSFGVLTLGIASAHVAMIVLWASPAHAYVGPGAGLGLLGALAAMMAVISTSVGVIVMGPIRRWLARRRRPPKDEVGLSEQPTPEPFDQDVREPLGHLDDDPSSQSLHSGH